MRWRIALTSLSLRSSALERPMVSVPKASRLSQLRSPPPKGERLHRWSKPPVPAMAQLLLAARVAHGGLARCGIPPLSLRREIPSPGLRVALRRLQIRPHFRPIQWYFRLGGRRLFRCGGSSEDRGSFASQDCRTGHCLGSIRVREQQYATEG